MDSESTQSHLPQSARKSSTVEAKYPSLDMNDSEAKADVTEHEIFESTEILQTTKGIEKLSLLSGKGLTESRQSKMEPSNSTEVRKSDISIPKAAAEQAEGLTRHMLKKADLNDTIELSFEDDSSSDENPSTIPDGCVKSEASIFRTSTPIVPLQHSSISLGGVRCRTPQNLNNSTSDCSNDSGSAFHVLSWNSSSELRSMILDQVDGLRTDLSFEKVNAVKSSSSRSSGKKMRCVPSNSSVVSSVRDQTSYTYLTGIKEDDDDDEAQQDEAVALRKPLNEASSSKTLYESNVNLQELDYILPESDPTASRSKSATKSKKHVAWSNGVIEYAKHKSRSRE